MWCMIESLRSLVDGLSGAFTRPSFATAGQFLLGWVMCLGKHTLWRTAQSAQPQTPPQTSPRHGLHGYYNFFERSAWTPVGLAYHIAVLILTRLQFFGRITLLVDDTLAHKRGKSVWGMGWWRDAVASTKKRVATASGHNWVVLAVAYCLPLSNSPIFALPLLARLHLPGKGQPSCAALAKQMLVEVLGWFPKHSFTLVGDGAYACKELLGELDYQRVVVVGRMRGDACVHDPHVPQPKKGKRGRKAKKGPKLPKPKEAAAKADRKRSSMGAWLWHSIEVAVYGESRSLKVVSYEAVWPRVLGLRPIQIVVVRDPERQMKDCYLFTTDVQASVNWVVTQFAWRWAIEVLFRASKQVLDIEAPKHWSQESVEKVAPWVWSIQSVIMVWYLTVGHSSAEALELREVMGDWDSEWSLRHMLQVLRRAILNATINPNSADQAELTEMVKTLKNWANLAA
jgi:DDE superfamily endonuclease